MSQATSGFTPSAQSAQVQHGSSKSSPSLPYIPNEEERRVLKECTFESFLYRSLPFTAITVGTTHILLTKGILSPSPRFGAFPKFMVAILLGYFGGKMSYAKICQEKFMKLENSPLAEAFRQGQMPRMPTEENQTNLDPSQSESYQMDSTAQPSSSESYRSYTSDYTYSTPSQSYETTPFSSGFSDSGPANIRDDFPSQAPTYQEEDAPKKKLVLYEELRSKNRENYEVALPQRTPTYTKPHTNMEVPKRDGKKNLYGDVWEE